MTDVYDEKGITKDTSLYLIFRCEGCGQYMYVKPVQKTKKCLRCNRHYKVSKIQRTLKVDEVRGMSTAVNRVKELQNRLAIEELGTDPDLSISNRFIVEADLSKQAKQTEDILREPENNSDTLEEKFTHLLCELSKKYKTFPRYLIGLASVDYGIESSELELLIIRFIKQGKLVATANYLRFQGNKKKEEKKKIKRD